MENLVFQNYKCVKINMKSKHLKVSDSLEKSIKYFSTNGILEINV